MPMQRFSSMDEIPAQSFRILMNVGLYLLLKSHFVFFDYSEPLALFLLDYLTVMGLFVAIGYFINTSSVKTSARASCAAARKRCFFALKKA